MRALFSNHRSLPLLIPLVFGAILSVVLFKLASDRDMWSLWSGWLPYGYWPVFNDLAITLSHIGQAAAGSDPLQDPHSEFAYPRAVLALHHLGFHHLPWQWMGLLQSLCVATGIVYFLRPKTPLGAMATTLLFFTPALLLGFERANMDFALFLLCAASATAWARARTIKSLMVPIAGIMIAAMMKLHPVFSLCGAIVAETGKRRVMWFSGLAVLLTYWTFYRSDFGLIAQKVPVLTSDLGSWGCLLFFVRLERFLAMNREAYFWLHDVKWPLIALMTYLVAAGGACLIGRRLSRSFAGITWRPRDYACYWVGAAICCGSFAGANIAYRWIFVVLTLPLLLRLASAPQPHVALWSRLTLGAIAFSLLAPLHVNRDLFLIIQCANWSCILLLIVGCVAMRTVASPAPVPRLLADYPGFAPITTETVGERKYASVGSDPIRATLNVDRNEFVNPAAHPTGNPPAHQIFARSTGALHIGSPSLIPNARKNVS